MRTALDAQLGIAEESTWGTGVTVSRFYEFVSESLTQDRPRIESNAIRAGRRVQRSDRWQAGRKTIAGDVSMELATKSFGLWLKHAFGGVALSQPDAGGNPTVWDQTFTPAAIDGKGLTAQVGRPDLGATVEPFTYSGIKVANWELSCAVDEFAIFKAGLVGQDETTATGLAAASYPASLALLSFVQGSLTIGGSALDVRSASVAGDNGLKVDRHVLGAATIKEPLEKDLRAYTGSLDAFYNDLTAYNRFVNGTEAALVLLFQGATISGIYKYQLQVTCNVRFDGDTPTVQSVDEISQPLKFKCLNSGAGDSSAITAVYRSTDTAS